MSAVTSASDPRFGSWPRDASGGACGAVPFSSEVLVRSEEQWLHQLSDVVVVAACDTVWSPTGHKPTRS
jgi:hypothetical protein